MIVDHLSKRNEESDNHTSLPSEKLGLKHEFDDVIPSTKPSWERHATEMSDNATWLLGEHQVEGAIKMRRSCVNCKKSDFSRPPTHWPCTAGEFKMKVYLSTQTQTGCPITFATPTRQGAGASLRPHAIRAQPNHQLGGSSPVLIGPQPVFADCSHMFSYPKLKMATSPYQCVSKKFFP